jgi:hypothetical protein
MREPYVHEATVAMGPDGDVRGPGAAITLELCGSWEHQPPCALAAHHTQPERDGETVLLRVVFAAEPEHENDVRRRIDRALRTGSVTGPDGITTYWEFRASKTGALSPAEADHGRRIADA